MISAWTWREYPMQRLLQGEVGSGKTVVAVAAMLQAAGSGHQAVLVAPTQVLAEQHHATISAMLCAIDGVETCDDPSRDALSPNDPTDLIKATESAADDGDAKGRAVRETSRETQWGTQRETRRRGARAVGREHAARAGHPADRRHETGRPPPCSRARGQRRPVHHRRHARRVLQDVPGSNLALVVIDEQHRFGVEQRESLRTKNDVVPHLLVMTATPIPRTAAMTWFGDLDISWLTELPGGRKPIRTFIVPEDDYRMMGSMFAHIRYRIDAGERAYVVCPRIDADDESDGDDDTSGALQIGVYDDSDAYRRESATAPPTHPPARHRRRMVTVLRHTAAAFRGRDRAQAVIAAAVPWHPFRDADLPRR